MNEKPNMFVFLWCFVGNCGWFVVSSYILCVPQSLPVHSVLNVLFIILNCRLVVLFNSSRQILNNKFICTRSIELKFHFGAPENSTLLCVYGSPSRQQITFLGSKHTFLKTLDRFLSNARDPTRLGLKLLEYWIFEK